MSEDDSYNDGHRAFLQAFLARGCLNFDASQSILAAISSISHSRDVLPNDVTETDLRSYIDAVNEAISPLDLEIRSTFHQETRERVYALVNMSSDPLTQMATIHSAEEIAFVKRVLDYMFDGPANTRRTEAMCISGTDAVNLARVNVGRRESHSGPSQPSQSQGISMREAEAMMAKLVDEGWLDKSPKAFYTLSPRALMELRGWLVDTYNDSEAHDQDPDSGRRDRIKFCQACREIVTLGQRCSDWNCPSRLHDICTANFFRMQRNQNCPACGREWDGQHYVGQRALLNVDKNRQHRRSANPKPSSSRHAPPVDAGGENGRGEG